MELVVLVLVLAGIGLLTTGYLIFLALTVLFRKSRLDAKRMAGVVVRAVLGLCVMISGYQAYTWTKGRINAQDRKMIDIRYSQFHLAMHAKRYEEAYGYMSPAYRKGRSVDQFREDFSFAGDSWLYLDTHRHLRICGSHADLYPGDSREFPWSGPIYKFVKADGDWYVDGEFDWSLD